MRNAAAQLVASRAKAEELLRGRARSVIPHLIDGAAALSTFRETFESLDPTTNQRHAAVAAGDAADVDRAAGAAAAAFKAASWVPTPINIVDLLDHMATTGNVANIERGLGRHGISSASFLYMRDPGGHRIEIFCSDHQTVDPDHEPIRWDLRDPQRQTLRGAPQSWFEDATLFEGTSVRQPSYAASPIVAPRGARV